ncbi:MAG: zinc ribbon domain-containing protein [bacterium]
MFGPSCQSCGMPLAKDEQGGGTEADGSLSTEYCSHCYQHGAFTLPDITVDEMQQRVKDRMEELQMPGFVAKMAAISVPKLRRWAGKSD